MFNPHPPLTAFPLALLVVAAILEIVSAFKPTPALRSAIRVNLMLSVVFVAAAFFSGYWASDLANQTFTIPDKSISKHHNAGRILLFLILPCAALEVLSARAVHNPKVFRALYILTLISCVGLVVYTGYLGGQLVFVEGAGVSAKINS